MDPPDQAGPGGDRHADGDAVVAALVDLHRVGEVRPRPRHDPADDGRDVAGERQSQHLGQVGELYAVPGGPLWRAAAQEVRLVLEQRLGLAKK